MFTPDEYNLYIDFYFREWFENNDLIYALGNYAKRPNYYNTYLIRRWKY